MPLNSDLGVSIRSEGDRPGSTLGSLHHVTAIASNLAANVHFYSHILGMRLVKKTVNFDDPGSYHLYYGDYNGSPGSLMTFFIWPGTRPASERNSVIAAVGFVVAPGSIVRWRKRLEGHGVTLSIDGSTDNRLDFLDPDGLPLFLLEDQTLPAEVSHEPSHDVIARLAGVVWSCRRPEKTADIFTQIFNYRGTTENPSKLLLSANGRSQIILRPEDASHRSRFSPGQVHHAAFRAADLQQQAELADRLRRQGISVTPVQPRKYFDSVYFMEPGGGICEIATDGPGMTVDEPLHSLGSRLCLPPALESQRMEITSSLPPFDV